MRTIPFVLFISATAGASPSLDALKPIMGHWRGSDPAKHETGEYTLEPSLGGKVLLRHNTDDSPQGHHEDLMVIFVTPAGLRASYWDNEGHAINYAVDAAADHVELLSDQMPNMPRFKLRYDVKGPDELAIDFSIAMPGSTEMKHYTGGVVHRVR